MSNLNIHTPNLLRLLFVFCQNKTEKGLFYVGKNELKQKWVQLKKKKNRGKRPYFQSVKITYLLLNFLDYEFHIRLSQNTEQIPVMSYISFKQIVI